MKRFTIYVILFSISTLFIHNKVIAQKTDTIIHINGDVLTGDLKKLVYGVATWKMSGMGTISMDEIKIRTIKSKKLFEIKMKSDFIYYGSFDTSAQYRKVYIVVSNGRTLVDVENIVEIYPIKKSFWSRTSGNFNLGANFSKGSNVGTLSFSGNLSYRKKKTYYNLSWDDNNTYQGDSLSSTKSDAALAWQRTLKKGWYAQLAVGVGQNSELGTKLRTDVNMTGIKDVVYNNWNRLYGGAGFSLTREKPYGDTGDQNDVAGLFNVVWKVYKYTAPKVWVDASISFIPYITGGKRYRSAYNLYPQISVFSDNFKVGLQLYYNFDSNPPPDATSNDDYGLNLTMSYSFH